MAQSKRVYKVQDRHSKKVQLVRAANPAVARSHAAHKQFEVSVASVEDVHALRDVPIEDAGAEPAGAE